MSTKLKYLFVSILSVIATGIIVFGSGVYAKQQPTPTPVPVPIKQVIQSKYNLNVHDIITLVNKERTRNGLAQLEVNQKLTESALIKARDMVDRDYWAHIGPGKNDKISDSFNKANYSYSWVGEDLARDFYTSTEVMAAWMNSPTHKAIILDTHPTQIGVAIEFRLINNEPYPIIVLHEGKAL